MATWPDKQEFLQFLVASGLSSFTNQTDAQSNLDLQGALDAAVEEWNDRTHYWPFLSTGVDEARTFTPVLDDLIDLNGGLVAITSVKVDVTYANSTGVTWTQTRDYVLLPGDAAQRVKPWTMLRRTGFAGWYTMDENSIVITGKWGYCLAANLPATARRAVMAMAAQELMPQIAMALSRGGLKRHQQGDSTKEWASMAERASGWQSMVNNAVRQYARSQIA